MNRNLIIVVSVVIPMSILGLLYQFLENPTDQSTDIHPGIIGLDERFQSTEPEIIIAGSSVANKAIEGTTFAKLMGVPQNKVQVLWSGKATMFVIDMMIEQRILKKNIQPKAIVIISPPYWLGNYDVLHDEHFAMHNTGPIQSVVQNILEEQGYNVPSTFKQRKKLFQNQYQSLNQQIVGQYFWGLTTDELDEQLEIVFAGDNTRSDLKPTHQLIQANATANVDTVTTERTAFDLQILKHLAEKLETANIQLSIVTAPVSADVRDSQAISDAEELLLKEVLKEHNAGYLSFYEWEIPGMFIDNFHMGRLGRKEFTPMLAAKLQEQGLLTTDFPKEISIETLTTLTVAPTIQWSNTVGLLMPKEALAITFSTDVQSFHIKVCASSKKPSPGELSLEGIPLTKVQGNDQLWCEEQLGSNIQANTSMRLLNAHTTPITIHTLELNGMNLLDTPKNIVVNHTEWDHYSRSTLQHTMSKLEDTPAWIERKMKSLPHLQVGELSRLSKLSDVRLLEANIPRECRPIQVTYNNNLLPIKTCKELWQTQDGQCFYRDEFVIHLQEPIQWSNMTLQLNEDRFCKTKKNIGYWFHPGDQATSSFNYPKGEYSTLLVEGSGLGEGPWKIELFEQDEIFVKQTITQKLDGQFSILLEQPFKKKHHQAQIRISVPEESEQHLFIQTISLTN